MQLTDNFPYFLKLTPKRTISDYLITPSDIPVHPTSLQLKSYKPAFTEVRLK